MHYDLPKPRKVFGSRHGINKLEDLNLHIKTSVFEMYFHLPNSFSHGPAGPLHMTHSGINRHKSIVFQAVSLILRVKKYL